jgi:hypothetical protein
MAKSAATLAGDLADLAAGGSGVESSRRFGGAGVVAASIDCSPTAVGVVTGIWVCLPFFFKKSLKNDKSPF